MRILLDWAAFKARQAAKNLSVQYVAADGWYDLWMVDGTVSIHCRLQQTSPAGEEQTDFETNFLAGANAVVQQSVYFSTPQLMWQKPIAVGSRAYSFGHNFCDKTTWFGDAVRVVDEAAGTGDGVTTVFALGHVAVIDVTHGKQTDEDYLVPTAAQGGATYKPEIRVAGVVKTEREFAEASGGDYEINYGTGQITFYAAPANGAAITATYFYSPPNAGSTVYIRPAAGKKLNITRIETQFSADLAPNDELISAVFVGGYEYPGSRITFKTLSDFVNYTFGSWPIIPAISAANARGIAQDTLQLRFDFLEATRGPLILDSAYGMEMRLWTRRHRVSSGGRLIMTAYGFEE